MAKKTNFDVSADNRGIADRALASDEAALWKAITEDVTPLVKMTNKGKDWWQPFYKSSGTSSVEKADIASGKLILTLAWLEEGSGFNKNGINIPLQEKNNSLILDGLLN